MPVGPNFLDMGIARSRSQKGKIIAMIHLDIRSARGIVIITNLSLIKGLISSLE